MVAFVFALTFVKLWAVSTSLRWSNFGSDTTIWCENAIKSDEIQSWWRDEGGELTASYILFEKAYCEALIKTGYNDAIAQKEEILAFVEQCNL